MARKILVIDDDPAILGLLRDYLGYEGFYALTAINGTDGLKLIESQAPDLVLLDWMLPDVTGLDICKYVRESRAIPIIMLTGRSGESDRILAFEAGVDDYIVKPISMLELVARIRSVLRRSV